MAAYPRLAFNTPSMTLYLSHSETLLVPLFASLYAQGSGMHSAQLSLPPFREECLDLEVALDL